MRLAGMTGSAVLLLLGACGDEPAAEERQRRELLRAPDMQKLRAERVQRVRVADEEGALLEAEEVVAGVRLPKGFELQRELEHEWYYRSKRVTFDQLDDYFAARLDSVHITRIRHSITYERARPKGQPDAQPITVRFGSAPSAPGLQEIYVKRRDPDSVRKELLTEAQVRAEMEAARKVAE